MLPGAMVDTIDGKRAKEDEEHLFICEILNKLEEGSLTHAITANQSSSPKLLTTRARQ